MTVFLGQWWASASSVITQTMCACVLYLLITAAVRRWDKAGEGENDGAWAPTALGKAAVLSSLTPDDILDVQAGGCCTFCTLTGGRCAAPCMQARGLSCCSLQPSGRGNLRLRPLCGSPPSPTSLHSGGTCALVSTHQPPHQPPHRPPHQPSHQPPHHPPPPPRSQTWRPQSRASTWAATCTSPFW